MRFEPLKVIHRGDLRIAHIRDTEGGRDLYVYCDQAGRRYRHWLRPGSVVTSRYVCELAREVLLEDQLEEAA